MFLDEIIPNDIVLNSTSQMKWEKGNVRSGKTVTITGEFSIASGSDFHAYIEPMRSTTLQAKQVVASQLCIDSLSIDENKNSYYTSSEVVATDLQQNYPNPFNPNTIIKFTVPGTIGRDVTSVSLKIFNSSGQLVKILVSNKLSAGSYSSTWNARDNYGKEVPNGMYYCQMVVDNKILTKKMLFLK